MCRGYSRGEGLSMKGPMQILYIKLQWNEGVSCNNVQKPSRPYSIVSILLMQLLKQHLAAQEECKECTLINWNGWRVRREFLLLKHDLCRRFRCKKFFIRKKSLNVIKIHKRLMNFFTVTVSKCTCFLNLLKVRWFMAKKMEWNMNLLFVSIPACFT